MAVGTTNPVREKVWVVSVKGDLSHQRLQVSVTAPDSERAIQRAVKIGHDRYNWAYRVWDAEIVTHEGKPLQPERGE